MNDSKLILVTGTTGYVGGRLVPRLLAAGHRVRCVVRDTARLISSRVLGPTYDYQTGALVRAGRMMWLVFHFENMPYYHTPIVAVCTESA